MTADKEEFLNILEKNIGIIIKISRVYAKVEQDREDLINDITLELWKSYKSFKGNSKISTWIYRVALNVSMNYRRNRSNSSLLYSINDFKKDEIRTWIISQDNSSESELTNILYDCIDDLGEINKAIILLYLDGNSYDEISEIIGMSKTNVGTRIGRIKVQIKNLITLKQ
jgi:RNA polymerase sigma-70 factor (ECF subfamily)